MKDDDDQVTMEAFAAIQAAGLAISKAIDAADEEMRRNILHNSLITEINSVLGHLDSQWYGFGDLRGQLKELEDHAYQCPHCRTCEGLKVSLGH